MFKNLHEVYPEIDYKILINNLTNEEFHITMEQLGNIFTEDQILKIQNQMDPHWTLI